MIMYGYDHTFEINVNPTIKVPAVKDKLQMMKELREEIQVTLQQSQDIISRQNDSTAEHHPYSIGDKV